MPSDAEALAPAPVPDVAGPTIRSKGDGRPPRSPPRPTNNPDGPCRAVLVLERSGTRPISPLGAEFVLGEARSPGLETVEANDPKVAIGPTGSVDTRGIDGDTGVVVDGGGVAGGGKPIIGDWIGLRTGAEMQFIWTGTERLG